MTTFSLTRLVDASPRFRDHERVRSKVKAACSEHADVATYHALGESEEGRPLYGVELGTGPQTVSLIAGNHADEPVGPETLRSLILNGLAHRASIEPWLERFRFVIVPHTNPDGEARNRAWMEQWPDLHAYLRHVEREAPGRDLEFGFPDLRVENQIVSAFLESHAPFALHISLHGMAVGEGGALLINRAWSFRTQSLRNGFVRAAAVRGLRLHDHNRRGEKGFFWIEPGFQTTPRGDAMRTFFHAQNDPETASKFRQSSMEVVAGFGGDPLALVTELPLFVIENPAPTPGVPAQYLKLRERLPEIRRRLARDASIDDLLDPFNIEPLPLDTAMQMQFRTLELGLSTVHRNA